MQPTDNALDDAQCIALVTRFYWHLDCGEFAELDALMTRDGLYFAPDGSSQMAGAALINDMNRRLNTGTSTMVHMLTNLFVEPAASGAAHQATVRGFMTVYTHDDGKPVSGPAPLSAPKNIWTLNIQVRKDGGRWLIARVDNALRFVAPKKAP